MSFIVAIDGPAGTGKGTVTRIIANDLNLLSIDTGAMYRCVSVYTLRNNINLENFEQIEEMFENIKIDMIDEAGNLKVLLNNEDVSKLIRTPEIDKQVEKVARVQEIRIKMVELMRQVAEGKNVIMEGRDIGTAVFPNANVKIYLDAKPEERARRRYKENLEKNIECNYEKILEDMISRDKSDMTKGGLKKADDAILIDNTDMSIEEVVKCIEKIVNYERTNK